MAKKELSVEALKHRAKRTHIPTAELETTLQPEVKTPIRVAIERRNRDLDPQLVWRGKDEQDWSELVVQAPPLYIQEKVHPKVLIEDLKRETKRRAHEAAHEVGLVLDRVALRDDRHADDVGAVVGIAQRRGLEAALLDQEELVVGTAEQPAGHLRR